MRGGKQVKDKRVTAKKRTVKYRSKIYLFKKSIKNPAPKRAGFKYKYMCIFKCDFFKTF